MVEETAKHNTMTLISDFSAFEADKAIKVRAATKGVVLEPLRYETWGVLSI